VKTGPDSVPKGPGHPEKAVTGSQIAISPPRPGLTATQKASTDREKARSNAPRGRSKLEKAITFMETAVAAKPPDALSLDLAAPVKPMAARRLESGLVPF